MVNQVVSLAVLVLLIVGIVYMIRMRGYQGPDAVLSGKDKLIVWLVCIFNPIWGGAIFYYGLKNKFPQKAKQANKISMIAFLVTLVVYIGWIFLVNSSGVPSSSQTSPQSNLTETPVTSALYSYTLPAGWQNATNSGGQGLQALNQANHYLFSITTDPLQASEKITSIEQLVTPSTVNQLIQKEFSNTTINNSAYGSLDGQKALVTTFSGTIVENVNGTQQQSAPLSMLQYNAIYNGILYTVVLMEASSNNQNLAAIPDFQTITNSFTFK